MFVDHRLAHRKAYLINLLARMCAELDITESRLQQAKERYEGVARWLAAGEHFLLHDLSIYLQGSTALGTSVRPIGKNEHDVDLVAFMPAGTTAWTPAYIKKMIGDRLKAHATYARLLEEKIRCWRLVYANEFHLDITPSILNLACRNQGELVPDKSLREWKGSNPRGYRKAFEARAALAPVIKLTKAFDGSIQSRADIEPFPVASSCRSILCNIVQVAKRHRDVHFEGQDLALWPISVILTTLIAWSYERCVKAGVYNTEFDLMIAALRGMPDFIGRPLPDGSPGWYIPNETTIDENFAERWNDDPDKAMAFFTWHAKAVADMENLARVDGTDQVRKRMEESFGPRPVGAAFTALDNEIASARRSGLLGVAPLVGLTAARTSRPWSPSGATPSTGGTADEPPFRPRRLTLAQQHVNLRASPITRGDGGIAGSALTWRFQASPSPISRTYDLRLTYRVNGVPATFVDQPDLTSRANGARIPHLYSEQPARLCLYLPSAYEWRSSMLLDRTIVPWAILWLWFFEDWLATGEWRGGGVHVSPDIEAEIMANSPGLSEVLHSGKESA